MGGWSANIMIVITLILISKVYRGCMFSGIPFLCPFSEGIEVYLEGFLIDYFLNYFLFIFLFKFFLNIFF